MCHKQKIKDLRLFCRDLSYFKFTHFLRKVIGKNYGWRKVIHLLCTGEARRGQLVPAAGATADSPDQKGLVGDKGQVRSFPGS